MSDVITVPRAPNKLDIIPIHASDRGSFKSCRRKWDWSSPMRMNLTPKPEEHGIVFPLWFGSGIHWALKHYYDPVLKRDPVEVFKTWWDVQMNGGIITEDWLETVLDRNPKMMVDQVDRDLMVNGDEPSKPPQYIVKGLNYLLPTDMSAEQQDEFQMHYDLGIGMLNFYKKYAEKNDNFTVIAAEHTFSVPIYDFEKDCELTAIDIRDGKEKPVHLRGTQDALIRDNDTEKYGILEHKSAIKIDEDYFIKLDKDEQCTTYMFAGEVEARVHDLPYKEIDFVLYNAIRKAFPRWPTITTRGDISIDRSKESTTVDMLMKTIDDMGMGDTWQEFEKLRAYVEYVRDAGDEQFVMRNMVRRNRHEIYSCGERVFLETKDMLNDPSIYPNPTGNWSCLKCIFRAPCIAKDDGSEWEWMLNEQFERNHNR